MFLFVFFLLWKQARDCDDSGKLRLKLYEGVFVFLQQRSKHLREIVVTPKASTSIVVLLVLRWGARLLIAPRTRSPLPEPPGSPLPLLGWPNFGLHRLGRSFYGPYPSFFCSGVSVSVWAAAGRLLWWGGEVRCFVGVNLSSSPLGIVSHNSSPCPRPYIYICINIYIYRIHPCFSCENRCGLGLIATIQDQLGGDLDRVEKVNPICIEHWAQLSGCSQIPTGGGTTRRRSGVKRRRNNVNVHLRQCRICVSTAAPTRSIARMANFEYMYKAYAYSLNCIN